jgi:hypothetical protein
MVLGQRGFGTDDRGDGGPDAPPTARWLALAAACLLVAAMVSAGIVGFGRGPSSSAVVSAAGTTASTIGAPSTVTAPPPSTAAPAAPTSTIRTTTTLPRAAAAVLKAIGTTAPPTTRAPAPSTTQPPATSTTVTTQPPTTSTTAPNAGVATVTVVNAHGQPLVVVVNGRVFDLDQGESEGPAAITLPLGDDIIQVGVRNDATCTARGSADYFVANANYRVTIAAGPTPCTNFPAPTIEVTLLP